MANKIMIVLKFIQSNLLLLGTLVTSRGLEFASQLWLLSLIYIYIYRVIDTDAFWQENGGPLPGHILQDRETIDTASER